MPIIATTTLEQASQISSVISAILSLFSLVGLGFVIKFTNIIKNNNISQKIGNITIVNGGINGDVADSFNITNKSEIKN